MTLSRQALFRIGICLAVLLLILAATVEFSRWRLLAYKAELKAKGESLDLESLSVAVTPEIASRTRDFAGAGAEIATALKSSPLRFFTPPYPADPGRRSVFHRKDLPMVSGTVLYSWTAIEADCQAIEPALSRVREVTRQGPLEAYPDYTRNYAAILPQVDEAQCATFALIAQSYLHLRNGDPVKAGENIEATLRISAMLYRQKTAISQALGMGLLNISSIATWDLLQAPNLSDSTLLSLQRQWEAVHIIEMFKDTLRTERNFGLHVFTLSTPNSLGSIPSIASPTDPHSLEAIKLQSSLLLWRTLFRYSDERQYLATCQAILESAPDDPGIGSWEAAFRAAETHIDPVKAASISRLVSKLVLPSKISVLYPIAAQTQAHLTVFAIAIRRYQLAHGELPDSLAELHEQLAGKAPPPDLFNGQPLHYRKVNDTEYLLYSIGTNFTDDGGSATDRRILKSADIVWPMPETEAGGTAIPVPTPAPADNEPDRPRESAPSPP